MGFIRDKISSLIIPKPVGVRCGFCPTVIFQRNEAMGRLFIKSGRPICAKCRILQGSIFSKKIIADKKHFIKDMELKEKLAQEAVNELVRELAMKTQKDTKTGMIKK